MISFTHWNSQNDGLSEMWPYPQYKDDPIHLLDYVQHSAFVELLKKRNASRHAKSPQFQFIGLMKARHGYDSELNHESTQNQMFSLES